MRSTHKTRLVLFSLSIWLLLIIFAVVFYNYPGKQTQNKKAQPMPMTELNLTKLSPDAPSFPPMDSGSTSKTIPAEVKINVRGILNPNPVEITPDGYAYPDLTVIAETLNIPEEMTPTFWELKYRIDSESNWISIIVPGEKNRAETTQKIKIDKKTDIQLHATVHYADGQSFTATDL